MTFEDVKIFQAAGNCKEFVRFIEKVGKNGEWQKDGDNHH